MTNENVINKAILVNHFSGNATPLQRKLIEEWLAEPDNVEYYYECLNEWENNNAQFVANDTLALKRVIATKNKEEKIKQSESTIRMFGRRFAVAAIILLVVGVSLFLGKDAIIYKSIETTYGEIKQVTLPDGSIVTLNANSEIRFSRFNFSTKTREVMLNGEADFSVVHTKSNQKFIVKTDNNLHVTVLGTQFSVYARNTNDRVVLRKGKVELDYVSDDKRSKQLILRPGDVFTQKIGGGDTLAHITDTEKEVIWKTHDFLFESTSLSEIATMLKDNFGINARFQNQALASRKISGSFHAEKAEELVDAISQLLDINYKIRNNVVYFYE